MSSNPAETNEAETPGSECGCFSMNGEPPARERHTSLSLDVILDLIKQSRDELDYTYHKHYPKEREDMQNRIVAERLADFERSARPKVIYSAGAMGAGKSYAFRRLSACGFLQLNSLAWIDSDNFKPLIPEYKTYLQEDHDTAATKVHQETALLSELSVRTGLKMGIDMVVDGSLQYYDWHKGFFAEMDRKYPSYRRYIVHVKASPDLVYARARKRAIKTGRVVPEQLIAKTLAVVPVSIRVLAPVVSAVLEFDNSDKLTLERTLVNGKETKGSLVIDESVPCPCHENPELDFPENILSVFAATATSTTTITTTTTTTTTAPVSSKNE